MSEISVVDRLKINKPRWAIVHHLSTLAIYQVCVVCDAGSVEDLPFWSAVGDWRKRHKNPEVQQEKNHKKPAMFFSKLVALSTTLVLSVKPSLLLRVSL